MMKTFSAYKSQKKSCRLSFLVDFFFGSGVRILDWVSPSQGMRGMSKIIDFSINMFSFIEKEKAKKMLTGIYSSASTVGQKLLYACIEEDLSHKFSAYTHLKKH